MNTFDHPKIGKPLIRKVADTLAAGQTVALLGGRDVGKRYVLRHVYKRLVKQGRRVRVASLLHWGNGPLQRTTAAETLGEIPNVMQTPDEIVDWWKKHHDPADPSSAILLVGNVDGLSFREGLQMIEAIKRIGWSGIGTTFEVQSADLFRGEAPRLSFDYNAVVTGFEAKEFRLFADAYIKRLWPRRKDHAEIVQKLYVQTGGNVYFLRVALWTHFDLIAAADGSAPKRFSPPDFSDQDVAHQVPWNHYLRYVTRLIGNSPDVLDRLETLVQDRSVAAGTEQPDILELSGIPIWNDGRLVLPPGMLGSFLSDYYSIQRIADLYTGRGEWLRAFRKLRTIPRAGRFRPSSADDIPDAHVLVKRLGAALHQEAARRPPRDQPAKRKPTRTDRVRRMFSLGCRLLLGFHTVSFWEKPPRKDAKWHRLGMPQGSCPGEFASRLPDRPLEQIEQNDGFQPTDDGNYLIMILRGNHHDCPVAAIAGDREAHPNQSRTRTELLTELFKEFRSAYHHALEVDASERRTRGEGHLSDVVSEILAGLGKEVQTRRGVVELAARTLGSKLGYSRVLVSLISPDRKRLERFYEFPSTDDQDLLKAANYSLDPPDSSLHVRAVCDRKSVRVTDFRSDSPGDLEAVARGEIEAGAIVLLDTGRIDRKGRPYYLGTFLVERGDGLPPDPLEFKALVAFGRKFAMAIEQGERVQLLQTTLDMQRQPLAIVDAAGNLRYTSARVSPYMDDVDAPHVEGWKNPETAQRLDWSYNIKGHRLLDRAAHCVQQAFLHENRVVKVIEGPSDFPSKTFDVHADVIAEQPEGPSLGAFVEVQDHSFLYQILNGLNTVLDRLGKSAGAPACGERLEDVPEHRPNLSREVIDGLGRVFTEKLGYELAYFEELVAGADPPELIRRRRYESKGGIVELNERIDLARDLYALACFKEPQPVMFRLPTGDGGGGTVPSWLEGGLVPLTVSGPESAPPDLPPDRVWLDFPILAGNRPLGKLVLVCNREFLAEDFALLKPYLDLVGHVLGSILATADRLDRLHASKVELLKKGETEAYGQLIHDMNRSAEAILRVLQSYEVATAPREADEELKLLIRQLLHILKLALQSKTLTQILKMRQPLLPVLRKQLQSMAPGRHNLADGDKDAPDQTFPVEIDEYHFPRAVCELIFNSWKYRQGGVDLSIEVRVEEYQDDQNRPWVRIVYQDNGPGIAEDDLKKVFDEGFRAVPKDRTVEGQGKGLAYVRQVIDRLDGSIHAEFDEARPGAKFVLSLPLADADEWPV
jgi:signal transduction histidine kinase